MIDDWSLELIWKLDFGDWLFQNICLIICETACGDELIGNNFPIHHAENPFRMFGGEGLMRHEDDRLPFRIEILEDPHNLQS